MESEFQRLLKQKNLSSTQRAIVEALDAQQRVTSFPYYSKGRITATRATAAGIHTWTVAANQVVRLFGYAIGDDMGVAGRAGLVATAADTNLQTRSRTIGGQAVHIKGISLQLLNTPTSNPAATGAAWEVTSVRINLNAGENSFLLGMPHMLPGAGGLYGGARDGTGVQPIPGGRPEYNYFTNGLPGQHDVSPVPEGLIWFPEGEQDSTLNITLTTERAGIAIGGSAQHVDEVAAAGIRGFAFPGDVFVDFVCRLHGSVWAPRSKAA